MVISMEDCSGAQGMGTFVHPKDCMYIEVVTKAHLITILAQYESERRKYAQDLIDFDKEYSALFSGKPRTSENQDGISHDQFLKYAYFPLPISL